VINPSTPIAKFSDHPKCTQLALYHNRNLFTSPFRNSKTEFSQMVLDLCPFFLSPIHPLGGKLLLGSLSADYKSRILGAPGDKKEKPMVCGVDFANLRPGVKFAIASAGGIVRMNRDSGFPPAFT